MKLIKLLIIAVLLGGGIWALVALLNSNDTEVIAFDPQSPRAKEWKAKIDTLCSGSNWNADGYDEIISGVTTDRNTMGGELLTLDEEIALNDYLFATSANYLRKQAEKVFSLNPWTDSQVSTSRASVDYLATQAAGHAPNSNLTEALAIHSQYRQLMAALNAGNIKASYSHPLKEFPKNNGAWARSQIEGMKYYKSHFSKNDAIAARVATLDRDNQQAEYNYYRDLELLVEEHYRNTQDLSALLEDEIWFDYNAKANPEAQKRLKHFVNS